MREGQVTRLSRLMLDKEMAEGLDGEAYLSAGLQTNWTAKADSLLQAARRNSTPAEISAAEQAALNGYPEL